MPWLPTTHLWATSWDGHHFGACLGHGRADNCGHVRSLTDSSIPLSTWRNTGCQRLWIEWFFPDTEEVTGSNPVAPTRHNVSIDPPLNAACQQIVSRSLIVTTGTL